MKKISFFGKEILCACKLQDSVFDLSVTVAAWWAERGRSTGGGPVSLNLG
jgi:hypothetical protein